MYYYSSKVAATSSYSGQAVAIEFKLILSDHPFWVYSLTLTTT